MFVASFSRTMAGAKRIVVDEPMQRVTPRRDRLNLISQEWQSREQPNIAAPPEPLPPIPEDQRIPKTDGQKIIAEVCRANGVSYADVMSRSRRRHIVKARHAAIWAIKDWNPSLSLPQIGRLLGGRDHTTILHALRKRGA